MKLSIRHITKDQSRDTGMAMVFILLILCFRMKREGILLAAMALYVVNMVVPRSMLQSLSSG